MASTCGSTLALLDAGVPIKAPVAGIAMGLIIEDDKKYMLLTDIVGLEDNNGDMDFKVAGTEAGITAIQLDVKTLKLTLPIIKETLAEAKKARAKILAVMKKTISAPRETVSLYAPKIKIIKIDVSKIGDLIGSGGRTIKGIIASTGAQVDVNDDGSVFVSSTDAESVAKAVTQIEGITKDPVPGEIYDGTVKRIQPFGCFIEILPGREGLVHVSDMSQDFVNNPADLVKVGDVVKVRVKEIDDLGRLNLSMLLNGEKKVRSDSGPRSGGGGGGGFRSYGKPQDRGGMRRDDRGGSRDNRRGGTRDFSRSEGPHFPTSRYIADTSRKFDR
jgi:polyribonucleotide nucleotidyltransferase